MTYQDVLGYGGHSSGFVLLPQDVAVTHFGRDGWTGERSISPAVERDRDNDNRTMDIQNTLCRPLRGGAGGPCKLQSDIDYSTLSGS